MVEVLDNLKVVSEITPSNGALTINCIFDSGVPVFHKSEILREPKIIDNVNGDVGELMITHTPEGVVELNNENELILETDDANELSLYHQVEINDETQTTDLLYDLL